MDNTEISERPDKWRIGQLLTMSFVLAMMLTVLSFAHFYIARDVFHEHPYVIHSIMYLHISSGKRGKQKKKIPPGKNNILITFL